MPIQQMFLGLGAAKDLNRYIWGLNDHPNSGGLGLNTANPGDMGRSSPTLLTAGDVPWVGHSCSSDGVTAMVREDGTLWSWGRQTHGTLGTNQATNTMFSSPVQVPGTTWSSTYNKFSGNTGHTFGNIKTDGTLWMWGRGSEGQLGLNNDNDRSSPVQIPGTNWVTIRATYQRTWGVKSDGTLWAWGTQGESLGINLPENAKRSSPTQIPGTTWTSNLSAGKNGGACIRTDGTLWMWGANDNGILGQNSPSPHKKSPVQVPGTTWASLGQDPARDIIFAFKTDGTLWSWGQNTHGTLGHNNRTTLSSPKQIPGTTWASVRACNYRAMAVKTDGTLWTWGSNTYGNLGHNNKIKYSSPVQVGSATGWQASSNSVGKEILSATLEE